MSSRIITSSVSRSRLAGLHLAGGEQPGATVNELTEFGQRRHSNPGPRVVGELLTGHRIQHPTGHGDLYIVAKLYDEAVCRVAPEPADDLYMFAMNGMVTIVD
jgi:hypothetical protein